MVAFVTWMAASTRSSISSNIRVRVVNTIKKMTGNAVTPEDKVKRATAAVLEALDKAHVEDKNFFYRNFALGTRKFDADYKSIKSSYSKRTRLPSCRVFCCARNSN